MPPRLRGARPSSSACRTARPSRTTSGWSRSCIRLGVRFMQVTYNNQSLLGSGCYEAVDGGISRMGREVIAEMNRLGLVIDLSHSGERTCLRGHRHLAHARSPSRMPIPRAWHDVARNKSDAVLKALAARGGMLGLSLYPHHLAGGSDCTLDSFTAMVRDRRDAHRRRPHRHRLGPVPGAARQRRRVDAQRPLDQGPDQHWARSSRVPAAAVLVPRQPRFPAHPFRGLAARGFTPQRSISSWAGTGTTSLRERSNQLVSRERVAMALSLQG